MKNKPNSKLLLVGLVLVGCLLLFYLLFFNYVAQHQIGITRNIFNGQVELQSAGMHFTSPIIQEISLDIRPHRVCITTASHIPYNCKLVKFVPEYYKEFIKTEGFKYFWWDNRFSINLGYKEEYRGFSDLLRGYAFSQQQYPFVQEIKDN